MSVRGSGGITMKLSGAVGRVVEGKPVERKSKHSSCLPCFSSKLHRWQVCSIDGWHGYIFSLWQSMCTFPFHSLTLSLAMAMWSTFSLYSFFFFYLQQQQVWHHLKFTWSMKWLTSCFNTTDFQVNVAFALQHWAAIWGRNINKTAYIYKKKNAATLNPSQFCSELASIPWQLCLQWII